MSISIDGVRVHVAPAEFVESQQPPAEHAPESTAAGPSTFERLLRGLGKNVETGERIVAGAASGYASLDPAELIALQAGIYRYSEAIDLTAKLVDRATSAVRSVLSGGGH
jgi:hypothetical protein